MPVPDTAWHTVCQYRTLHSTPYVTTTQSIAHPQPASPHLPPPLPPSSPPPPSLLPRPPFRPCLLYTSDAADDM
eukprot:2199682-Rhodomonas_salina.3